MPGKYGKKRRTMKRKKPYGKKKSSKRSAYSKKKTASQIVSIVSQCTQDLRKSRHLEGKGFSER
eukprot:SAG11_NODE_25_length_23789_cov_23.813592_9_plen_64_part_00